MSTSRRLKPRDSAERAGREENRRLMALTAIPGPDADLEAETSLRVAAALECDPSNPLKGQVLRKAAIVWLMARGFDLASHGLPLAVDVDEPEPAPEPPSAPGQTVNGVLLNVVGAEADRSPQLPPRELRNHEAEEGALVGMLSDPTMIAEVFDTCRVEDFSYGRNRPVARAIKNLADRGGVVDAANVIQELRGANLDAAGGAERIKDLASRKANAAAVRSHARIVAENARLKEAVEIADLIRREVGASRSLSADTLAKLRDLPDRMEDGCRAEPADAPAGEGLGWPAPIREEAWHGVAGDIIRAVAPQTEADPNALLVQFLVAFGSVAGRNAHWVVNSTRHYANLFTCVVGPSGVGSKGTGLDIIESFLCDFDEGWYRDAVLGGLSSGEGLIWAIRDAVAEDPGSPEKRALWIEAEFSKVLAKMKIDGSSLMENICLAWDGKPLRNSVRQSPLRCREPHVSIIGHSTIKVMRATLNDALRNSGFGNRFLWCCSTRARELPFGGNVDDIYLDPQRMRLGDALSFAADPRHRSRPFEMDRKASAHFTSVYSHLIRPRAGDAAPLLDRAHAMVRRIALIYALLDRSEAIRIEHLRAALAVWDYCEQSAEFLFGDPESDPLRKKALDLIRGAGEKGLTKTELATPLTRGRDREKVSGLLVELLKAGLISEVARTTGRKKTPCYVSSSLLGGARFARFGRKDDASPEQAKA